MGTHFVGDRRGHAVEVERPAVGGRAAGRSGPGRQRDVAWAHGRLVGGRSGHSVDSSYLGHPDGQVTIATHLLLAPYRTPRTWDVQHRAGELPVRHARRRCALDHFSVLRDELAALTHRPVRLDLDDAALERVDTA